MRTRSKALPVLLTALLVLGGTVGVSYAHAVQITQKQSPRQLKQSCDKAGGAYGITNNGTAWCYKSDTNTAVYCDVKTNVCDGVVPD